MPELGLTPFTKAALVTQIEVIEQAARGDQELRRAIAAQVTRHDGREDGMSPIAAAFAIWTGQARADDRPAGEDGAGRKGRWKKIRDMAKRARCTVAEWRVEARTASRAVHERQGRKNKKGDQRRQMLEETLLAEAQEKEGEESAQQWDAGNKHRAKKLAKQLAEEATAGDAKSLAVQGAWFRLAEMERKDVQWGQVVRRMKEDTRAWCVKAAIRVLPDATDRRRWGWSQGEELKCRCGETATDAHVLSACPKALQRYGWRRDGVLRSIEEACVQAAGAGWKAYLDLQTKREGRPEPHSQAWFAAHGVATTLRPDMLLVKTKEDGEIDRVIVLELSCPWEAETEDAWARETDEWAVKAKAAGWSWKNTVERRRAAKRFKYSSMLMNELPREWRAELLTVEIGARGLVGQETKQDVHKLVPDVGPQQGREAAS